jgi:UDP-glucose 4-epimerase
MNILLIGGGGFLGLNIAKALGLAEHRAHIADLNIHFSVLLKDVDGIQRCHELNGANVDGILELIERFEIECVINLASTLIPSSSYEEFSLEQANSVMPGFQLLNELAGRGIKYIYFSSGGTVYGSSDQNLVDEATQKNPISYYGLSKSLYEELILFMNRTRGLSYLILRPSNPFGPFQNPLKKQGLIAVAVDKMRKNQSIEIWGDGSVVRDYVWVGDLAQSIVNLLYKDRWNQIYNIGSGIGYSINEVLQTIQSLLPTKSKIIYTPPRTEDVKRIVLDIQKIQSDIVFQPIDLRRGIEMYIQGLECP